MSGTASAIEKLRNVAIIAHVDHGKTTLVDKLLQQSGTFDARAKLQERVMDSNAQESERGITILAKNTSVRWNGYHINILDTPGHADFGGEVERVLSMADSVLLLVDAVEGPMPQTRFVTQKAFAHGLKPIVVVNKIDRPGARPDWVIDQVFDLFDNLGATDEQLDFPIVYASAINGWATLDYNEPKTDINDLFAAIVEHVAPPKVELNGDTQIQVSQLDYSSYLGIIGIGRIKRGTLKPNQQVTVIGADGTKRNAKVGQVFGYLGLERIEATEANAGDIVAFTGLGELKISDTICAPNNLEPLPALQVDEPTVTMTFQVNTSPFAGKEGKFVTSRQILDRLNAELKHNVALRVEETEDGDKFKVSGRGELHLGVLIENMRREGFELAVSRPEVIMRVDDGVKTEPMENVTIDVEEQHQGSIMEKMGERKADLTNMQPDGKGRIRMDFNMPSRGLIGFRTEFMTLTSGTGLMYHSFDCYGPYKGGTIGQRMNGVLISNATGKAAGYAIFSLQERGRMFISHAEEVYEGQVIGIHSRSNDLTVNC
jgi:GTP-binding protein